MRTLLLQPTIKNTLDYYGSLINQYKKIISNSTLDRDFKNIQSIDSLYSEGLINFLRGNHSGHFTGSSFIVNLKRTKTLLTHHRKLNKWVQLGGHADGETDLQKVALKEAQEESGIHEVSFIPWYKKFPYLNLPNYLPFDLDIHKIPEYNSTPSHFHYDFRYLMELNCEIPLIISEESKDLKWVLWEELPKYSKEESITIQVKKAKYLLNIV